MNIERPTSNVECRNMENERTKEDAEKSEMYSA